MKVASRLSLVAPLLAAVPLTACAVAPGDVSDPAVRAQSSALTGGMQDTTHLAVVHGSNGCVGTFIAPGLVLTSATCFQSPAGIYVPPIYNFTGYDTAGNATTYSVGLPDFEGYEAPPLGAPCGLRGGELAMVPVSTKLPPEIAPAVITSGPMPGANGTVDLVGFGPADVGTGLVRRTATATVTQVAAPLLDISAGNGTLSSTDFGTPVFFGSALVGVYNCPTSGVADDAQSSQAWVAHEIQSWAAPSCSAPQVACRQSGTRNVPVVSIACSVSRAYGFDLFRWDEATSTSTRVASETHYTTTTFQDTPGPGVHDYIVESQSGSVELSVDVPECDPIVRPHCPKGYVVCDDGCARECL